jgi:acyl dehydratase
MTNQYVDVKKLEQGDAFPEIAYPPVTKTQLVRYAGASGDFNPIHTDDEAAGESGLKGVIAQGLLVMGFLGQAIVRWFPKRTLKKFNVRFKGMTFPGDIITVSATVAEKLETEEEIKIICDAAAKDQNGEVKISGQFEAAVLLK